MAMVRSARRMTGTVVTDVERKIGYAKERKISMFELRYKQRQPFDQKYFGMDDLVVERIERPNSYDVSISVRIEPGTDVNFTPNDENVLTAFVPDTPRNRRFSRRFRTKGVAEESRFYCRP